MLSNIKNKNLSVVKPSGSSGLIQFLLLLAGLVISANALQGCSAGESSAVMAGDVAKADTSNTPPADMKVASNNEPPSVVQARAVVRNGSLSVRVPDVEKAEKEVTKFVAANGGFVSNSESSNLASSSPTETMTVRIPVRLFDTAIDSFERMGTRLSKKLSGEDVTTKMVDYDARLKTMQAQEESFRNLLRTSSRSSESLDLQTRLMKLREEIESTSAQRKALADLAQLSTIELSLVGEARGAATTQDKNWAKESWNSATSTFSTFAQGFGSVAIFVGVFSPVWLPCAFFFWWLSKKTSKAKPGRI